MEREINDCIAEREGAHSKQIYDMCKDSKKISITEA